MPVVRSPDDYKVYIFIIDQPSPVFIKICRLLSTYPLNSGCSVVKYIFIYITQCNALYLGMFKKSPEVTKTHTITAYKTNINPVVCRRSNQITG